MPSTIGSAVCEIPPEINSLSGQFGRTGPHLQPTHSGGQGLQMPASSLQAQKEIKAVSKTCAAVPCFTIMWAPARAAVAMWNSKTEVSKWI